MLTRHSFWPEVSTKNFTVVADAIKFIVKRDGVARSGGSTGA